MTGQRSQSRYNRTSRMVVIGLAVLFLFAGSAALVAPGSDDAPSYEDRIDADATDEFCAALAEMTASGGPALMVQALTQELTTQQGVSPQEAEVVANDLIDACSEQGYDLGDR